MKPTILKNIYRTSAVLLTVAVLSSSFSVCAFDIGSWFSDKDENETEMPAAEETSIDEITEAVTEEPETTTILEDNNTPIAPIFNVSELTFEALGDDTYSLSVIPPEVVDYSFSYEWQYTTDMTLTDWISIGTTKTYYHTCLLPHPSDSIFLRCAIIAAYNDTIFEPVYTDCAVIEPIQIYNETNFYTSDFSWYTDSQTLTISSLEQLYAFSLLVNGLADYNGFISDDFYGKTINLDTNIYLNAGTFGISYENDVLWSGDGNIGGDFKERTAGLLGWQPIGSSSNPFNGVFNGNGHTINGLYINDSTLDEAGLFGCVGGVVKNLVVSDFYVNSNNNAGAIAGILNGTIINSGVRGGNSSISSDSEYQGCDVSTGIVISNGIAGGIVGSVTSSGKIINSYSDCFVYSQNIAGGISGNTINSIIANCWSSALCDAPVSHQIAGDYSDNSIRFCYTSDINADVQTFDSLFTLSDGSSLISALNDWLSNEGFGTADALKWEWSGSLPMPTSYETIYAQYDTSWYYNDDFTISDAFDLIGFSHILNGTAYRTNFDRSVYLDNQASTLISIDDFYGKTVTLGSDLLFNEQSNFDALCNGDGDKIDSLGSLEHPFNGIFDGSGYNIKGLYCEGGLFAYIGSFGEVRNLTIADSYFFGTDNVGAISAVSEGRIDGCTVDSIIKADGINIGGIVGACLSGSAVINCANISAVTGLSNVGGIVGSCQGYIHNSYNTAVVAGNVHGGIVGIGYIDPDIGNCLDTANGVICGDIDNIDGNYVEIDLISLNDWVIANNDDGIFYYWLDGPSFTDVPVEITDVDIDDDDKDNDDLTDDDSEPKIGETSEPLDIKSSIIDGRNLYLFDSDDISINSVNDVFTAQFVYEIEPSQQLPVRAISLGENIPIGASVIMTDRTDDRPVFYYYIINSNTSSEIPLTDFVRLGTSSEFYRPAEFETVITEKLLFTFDISACVGIKDIYSDIKISYMLDENIIAQLSVIFESALPVQVLSISDPAPLNEVFITPSLSDNVISGSISLSEANLPDNNPYFVNKNYILSLRLIDNEGSDVWVSCIYNGITYYSNDGWIVLPFVFSKNGFETTYSIELVFAEDYTPSGTYTFEQYLSATDDPRDASTENVSPVGSYEIGYCSSSLQF